MSAVRTRKTLLTTGSLLLGGALLLGGGWALASTFESPAQREARVRAPTSKPITAPIETGSLEEKITLRGTVQRGQPQTVHFPAVEGRSVVTQAPIVSGAAVSAGSVLSEINGRPLIALPGAFAFYRSLHPGDRGPDVRQLQVGLVAAGHEVVVDGVFGAATGRAIEALYRRAGYDAPTSAGDQGTSSAPSTAGDGPAPAASPGSSADAPAHPAQTPFLDEREVLVAALPAHVASVPGIGSEITDGSTVELQRGAPEVTASVPPLVAEHLTASSSGTFSAPSGDIQVTVATIGTAGEDSEDVPVLLRAQTSELLDGVLGQEGTVTVRTRLVSDQALIVPTSAVSVGGHGAAHVLVRQRDGSFLRVAVDELGQLDGRSAIRPVEPETIRAGDRVRID